MGKIIQVCSGADGDLYALDDDGSVYIYCYARQPGDYGQGRIYDGRTEGWAPLKMEPSVAIPHQLKAK